MIAPTSEEYLANSRQYLTLQMLWDKHKFPDKAVFRVNIAISVVLHAATEFAEHLEDSVSRVCILLASQLVR